MSPFRDASIRRKLLIVVMATTGVALLIACGAFVGYETVRSREALVEKARTLADIVATNSAAALLFDDASAARETLSALAADPEVAAAAVYASDGRSFARFARGEQASLPETAGAGSEFRGGHLHLFAPLEQEGDRLGTVYVRLDTSGMVAQIRLYLLIAAGVLLAALALAFGLASALQRSFSRPIRELLDRSDALARGDLTASVEIDRGDEVGLLGRSFNGMAQSLRGLVREVRENIRLVAGVSESLETTSGQVVEQTERQRTAVEDTGKSVERVTTSVGQVASSVDDLAEIASRSSTAISGMKDSIGTVTGHVERLASDISSASSASTELNASIEEIAEHTKVLERSSESTWEALGEQTRAVERVRESARRSHELSRQTSEEAQRGMRSVDDTVHSMSDIQTSFHSLQESIGNLSEHSQSVGRIVGVIGDLAEETNLLSLNAAIIAAQAGDGGKPFAVVADHVKALSERTSSSVQEISSRIEGIREGTDHAVRAVNDGADRVERGVERSREAGERLRTILDVATQSKEMVDAIVEATESQASGLSRVEEAMRNVREMVERTQRSTDEQSQSSAEIASMVERVRVLGDEVRGAITAHQQESQEVTSAVDRVATMTREIREATREQRGASEAIDAALGVFREVAAENEQRVSELRQLMTTLSERSSRLHEEIDRFTV